MAVVTRLLGVVCIVRYQEYLSCISNAYGICTD